MTPQPSAGIYLGFIFLCPTLLFILSKPFRESCLSGAHTYDALNAPTHFWTEFGLWGVITLWLGTLKWLQCQTLNSHLLDHGIYLNLFWNVAHGNGLWSSIMHCHAFGEHLNPILYLFIPPYWFFNSTFLPLALQTLFMMGGIAAVVRLAWTLHPLLPCERLLLILVLSLNWSFQGVHRFDFHPIDLAIPVIVILYQWAMERKWTALYFSLPVVLPLIQEDVCLMVLGLGLYLCIRRTTRRHGMILVLISGLTFWVCLEVIMRHFAELSPSFLYRYDHRFALRYHSMGGSLKQIVLTFALKPWIPLKILLQPSHAWPLFKQFLSFGLLPFGSPLHLLALIPPVLQFSLSDYQAMSKYGLQYAANILPFLMIGTLSCLSIYKVPKSWKLGSYFLLITGSAFLLPTYIRRNNPRMAKQAWELAHTLGPEVRVSAENAIGVPFCFRRDITVFPDVQNADMIIVCPEDTSIRQTFAGAIAQIEKDPQWAAEERDGLRIYSRKKRLQ